MAQSNERRGDAAAAAAERRRRVLQGLELEGTQDDQSTASLAQAREAAQALVRGRQATRAQEQAAALGTGVLPVQEATPSDADAAATPKAAAGASAAAGRARSATRTTPQASARTRSVSRGGDEGRSRSARATDAQRSESRPRSSAQGAARRDTRDDGCAARTRGASSETPARSTRARTHADEGTAQAQDASTRRRRPRRSAAEREELRARKRTLARMRALSVRVFAALLLVGALVGLAFFARPASSAVEKRELTKFPAFTLETFLDGSFFSDVSLWYSDTYPPREALVGLSQTMKSLYGVQPRTQLVGGNVAADELPVVPEGTAESPASADKEPEVDEGPVEIPTTTYLADEIQNKVMEGLYVDGDAAYNIYYFDQESVELYARAINTCAKNLEGEAEVYCIIPPTSGGAILDEDLLADLGGTNQREAIRYFMSLFDDRVHGVNVYDALRAHRDEYIYFRTDHHWTELGAYYAYVEFCKAKGVEPSDILAREKMTFSPFFGTFYAEVGNAAMEANPDYVDAYIPNSTNDMVVWDTEGQELEVNVITDVSTWNDYSGYNCFISGDRPLSRIDNPDKDDGSQCLVIKDSYGCAFVPLLVDDYQTTWVIDFRYSDRSIPDFVREQGIDDVIYLNAIVLAGTYPVAESLYAQAQSFAE